ncbi:MAG TPA: hypothetical protein VGL10_03305 [Gammaproteobacteria bacterium]
MLPSIVWASEVTLPNTFVAGERARANDVNENFDAVKDAVDDNHDRITDLESQVAEIGAVSVPPLAFSYEPNDGLGGCVFQRIMSYGFFNNATGNCTAGAPVSLPHNATITGASCLLYDNQATPSISTFRLLRISLTSEVTEVVYYNPSSTTSSASPVLYNMASNGTPGGELVDNTGYAYYITVTFATASLSPTTNLRLYGCKVEYTLGD